jgi:hypothetical protein
MHLLSSLNSGFGAAALGHAEIYVRGTSTRATWYASLEGDGANSSGANITLDAHGSALVYVNQLVDVVIKDVDGVSVRSYGDGVAAPNTEVRSLAFTGIDYDTAASAAGKPTNLKAMADLWLANNGAPDWKVLFNGAATTIQTALSALSGVFFNVKTYGAVGDGVASDQAAFSAALAAAAAAGGGNVYVPPGTHRLTAGLTWDARVNLVGVPGQSIITLDNATERLLTFDTASSAEMPCLFFGVSFQTTQMNSATVVRLDAATRLRCVACIFNNSATSIGIALQINTTSLCTLEAINCFFKIQSATLGTLTCNGAHTSKVTFDNCQWQLPAAYDGYTIDARSSATTAILLVKDCVWDAVTNATAGTYRAVRCQNGNIRLTGNQMDDGFTFAFVLEPTSTSLVFANDNSVRYSGSAAEEKLYSVTGTISPGSELEMPGVFRDTITTTATVPNGHRLVQYRGSSTVPTITLPTGYFPGQRLVILLKNESGNTWGGNVSFTGGLLYGTPATNAADGELVVAEFIFMDPATFGTYEWVGVSAKIGSA